MNYIELKCRVNPRYPAADILMSMLSDIGYESFVEDVHGFLAYIPQPFFDNEKLNTINLPHMPDTTIFFSHQLIKDQNWNEVWERNYKPVLVGRYLIRAPFHAPAGDDEEEIIISPKMSFGTGHHETTNMMIQLLEEINLEEKSFLDLGCGTGILTIIAVKKKASSATAVDIDRYAYENTLENLSLNNITGVMVYEGDIAKVADQKFDVIAANIYLNVLIFDMPLYKKILNPGGCILVSGLYETDLPQIKKSAKENGFILNKQKSKNKWVAITFINQ